MAHSSFRGGIYPHKRKRFTREKQVETYLPKGEMVYPLLQHQREMANPIVQVGDAVLMGQKIAEADGFYSAPIHASVSGTVLAIEPRSTVDSKEVLSIIIENNHEYESVPCEKITSLFEIENGIILEKIREAGIVGMGGAGVPTHVKLSVENPMAVRCIIVNCCESEPYLTSDYRRMLEDTEDVVRGAKVLLKLFERSTIIFAVEDNKRDAITALQQVIQNEKRMEMRVLRTKYPQGSERMLIHVCRGKDLNEEKDTLEAGCLVHNIDTVYAIARAVYCGEPLTKRIITVTGKALKNPRNYNVFLGTSFQELVNEAGGFAKEPKKFISGGPMMGVGMDDLSVPTVKTSSALVCMTKNPVTKHKSSACIRCGFCVDACPKQLLPSTLAKLADTGKKEEFEATNGLECMECGCCSYVCPARKSLTQSISTLKREILESKEV